MVRLGLFLTMNTHHGPRYGIEPLFIDLVPAARAFPVFTGIDCLDRLLDQSQTREVTFVQITEQVSVVADGCEITFILGVLNLDFFRGPPATVYRLDQVL